MTTDFFLASLREKLLFLPESDRNQILRFYSDMLSQLTSPEEVKMRIQHLGTPDEIAAKVKDVADQQEKTRVASPVNQDKTTIVQNATVAAQDTTVVAQDKKMVSREEDGILAMPKRSSIINQEVQEDWNTLYEDHEEEDRISFKHASKKKDSQPKQSSKKPAKLKVELPPITGANLMEVLMKKFGTREEDSAGLFGMLMAMFIPLLLIFSLALVLAYLAAIAAIALVVIALFVIILIFVMCGVAGLAYGIVSIFTQSTAIAMIEIGLSTIFFGIVTALTALCHELIVGMIPMIIKKVTKLYFWGMRIVCYKITGKNGLRDLFTRKKKV